MLKSIANLHKLCFPNKPWTENDFADLKKSGCEIVASENGFIVWRCVADECEIITIGVAPGARGTGIGQTLLILMENEIKNQKLKIRNIFLEVSEKNSPAIKLYERNGYKKIATRAKYYSDGSDAIIMQKQIPTHAGQK